MEKPSIDPEALVSKYKPDFAFAYGSGVFQQEGYPDDEKPMVDVVFGVRSAREWHAQNLAANGEDYSASMRWAGPKNIARLQRLGPGILYNTFVDFQGSQLKYGVMSLEGMRQDLMDWTHLYVAGRLQKPVQILKPDELTEAYMTVNYEQAINAALMLLPEDFTEEQFYETVAGLSYIGDSRMGVAENPKKVKNIVQRNLDRFKEMYREILSGRKHVATLADDRFQQDTDPDSRADLFHRLALGLQDQITPPVDFERQESITYKIRQGLARIVGGPTRIQTIKGFISSGPMKSAKYAASKIAKAWR